MKSLPDQIESLFERHPALCGFSVRSLDELPDNYGREEDDALFIADIGISQTMSAEQYRQMFEEIVVALAECLAEKSEAEAALSGRTFARALH